MKNYFYAIRFKKLLFYAVVLFMILLLTMKSKQTIAALQASLFLCYQTVIPSLFPFFVLSSLLTAGGFAQILARIFSPVMMPLFRINGAGALPFVVGIMSGYPTGAKTALELYKSGALSRQEAERLLPFSNNSGPLFIIGAVGAGMLNEPRLGIFLYTIHVISSLLVGLCFRFYRSSPAPKTAFYKEKNSRQGFSAMISDAVTKSVGTVLTVCGFILFFSAVTACLSPILDRLFPARISLAIKCLLEITGGAFQIVNEGFSLHTSLTWLSFFIGFGGFCVMLQVAGILSGSDLSLMPYMIGKLLHGIMSALITFFAFPFFQTKVADCLAPVGPAPLFPVIHESMLIAGLVFSIFFLIVLFINHKKTITK